MAILYIPDWDRLQHYKTRLAPWVKLYTSTLQSPKYRALGMAERGLLADLWRLAVETGNAIPDDPAWLAYKLGTDGSMLAPMLDALLADQHIVRASDPASVPLPSPVVLSARQSLSESGDGDALARSNGKRPQPEAPKPRNVHPAVAARMKARG